MTNLEALTAGFLACGVPTESFVLVGSAPLAVHQVRDVSDLDVLVLTWHVEIGEFIGSNRIRAQGVTYDGVRQVVHVDTPAGVVDLLHRMPRIGLSNEEVYSAGAWWPIAGRAVRVCSPRHSLAVKALAPSRPKHLADMLSLASIIANEAR